MPENAGPSPDGDMAVVFAVPKDLRTAALRCTPHWTLTAGGNDVEVTAPATEVPIDL